MKGETLRKKERRKKRGGDELEKERERKKEASEGERKQGGNERKGRGDVGDGKKKGRCTWVEEKKGKEKKKRGMGTEGERGKKLRKKRYFWSCKKNKYIKKQNSKVKIGSLVQWCFSQISKSGFFRLNWQKFQGDWCECSNPHSISFKKKKSCGNLKSLPFHPSYMSFPFYPSRPSRGNLMSFSLSNLYFYY